MTGHARRDLMLALLQGAGERGVTTSELLQSGVGSRYSARLFELRAQGYVISSERVRDGMWRYTLTDSPAAGSASVPTNAPLTGAPAAHHRECRTDPPASSPPAPGTGADPAADGQLFDLPTPAHRPGNALTGEAA